MTKAEEFHEKGYVLVTGILSHERVQDMIRVLLDLSQSRSAIGGWTAPDGLTRTRALWPLIFDPILLQTVRELLGDNIRFIQHNDLHVGFSSCNWHRDSVNRTLGEGPDWDETEPYRLARVGFYLQ